LIDKKILEIVVCPKCRSPLEYDEESKKLRCEVCMLAYIIADGIPLLIEEEAEIIVDTER